jgi:hypothetical protein
MKKLAFLFLAFLLSFGLSGSANAWEACETSVETLEVAGVVEFTSAFCDCVDGDVITIQITPADPAIMIDSVVFTQATPHPETNESYAEQLSVGGTTADVMLYWITEKTRTIHLWVYLSTGEHVGVNAQFIRD